MRGRLCRPELFRSFLQAQRTHITQHLEQAKCIVDRLQSICRPLDPARFLLHSRTLLHGCPHHTQGGETRRATRPADLTTLETEGASPDARSEGRTGPHCRRRHRRRRQCPGPLPEAPRSRCSSGPRNSVRSVPAFRSAHTAAESSSHSASTRGDLQGCPAQESRLPRCRHLRDPDQGRSRSRVPRALRRRVLRGPPLRPAFGARRGCPQGRR